MSIQAVAWAIEQKTGSPAGKVVLMCLANYADENGECWPSQATIAKETELSERSVREWLQRLEDAGLIEREHRQRADGSRKSDLIRMKFQPANFSGRTQSNRQDVPIQPAAGSGLTTFEPSVEPSDNYSTARTRADAGDLDSLSQRLCDAADGKMTTHSALVVGPIIEMIAQGVDLETDILPAIRAKAATLSRPVDLKYFLGPIRDAYEARIASGRGLSRPKPVGKAKGWVEGITDDEARAKWVKTLNFARPRDTWKTWLWGPPPGHAGCLVPSDLLEPRDLTRRWFEEKQPEAA